MMGVKKTIKRIVSVLIVSMLMVTVIVPPTSADAAGRITLKSGAAAPSSIYTGHSYTLKVAGTTCKFYSSNKKVAAVGLTQGKLKPVAPGTVKITAKSKKTGKTIATKSFTVLQRATSVSAEKELYLDVGQTAVLTATKKPETSTDTVRFYSNDKTVVTVGATAGKVTAKSQGKTTIKVISKATKATSNTSKNNKTALVTVYVGTFMEKVEQNRAETLKVTFKNDITGKDFKTSDFILTNSETKAILPIARVKTVDNKTILLTLYSDLIDGKVHYLSYDKTGCEFTASDGIVADLTVEPAKAQIQKQTPVVINTVDKNGVILDSCTKDLIPAEIGMTLSVNDGFDTLRGEVYFYSLASTAKVTAEYHTYKYESVDGIMKEKGAISREFIITAREKEEAKVNDYSIAAEQVDFEGLTYKQQTHMAMEDAGRRAYFQIGYEDGTEIISQDYKDYTLSSSDPHIFIIDSAITVDQTGGKSAGVTPIKEGNAYIIVKNDDGKAIATLPVTVVKKRMVSIITTAPSWIMLSNAPEFQDAGTTTVTIMDQYGEVMKNEKFSVNADKNNPGALTYKADNDNDSITFYGAGAKVGDYNFTLSAGTKTVKFSVKIKEPDEKKAATYDFSVTDSMDNTISADIDRNNLCEIKAYLTKCYADVPAAYVPITKSQLTIKSADGAQAILGGKLLTDQITTEGSVLKIPTIAYDSATGTYVQLPEGTYTVTIETLVSVNDMLKRFLSFTRTFKVTNTTPVLDVDQVETSLNDYAPMGTPAYYFNEAFSVTEDGKVLRLGSGEGSYKIISVDADVSGNMIFYKSVTLARYYNSTTAVQVTVAAINKAVKINLSYPTPVVRNYTATVNCEGGTWYKINEYENEGEKTYTFAAGTEITLRVYGGTATSETDDFSLLEPELRQEENGNDTIRVFTFNMPAKDIVISCGPIPE